MGYSAPDVVLGLDVDLVGVQLPHGVVASASRVDIAADGILGYSDNAEAGVKAWQTAKGIEARRSLAALASLCVRIIAGRVWMAALNTDANWLGKFPVQVRFYFRKVNERN